MKAFGDFAGAMTTVLTAMGDKLDLFKTLAQEGPATGDELAAALESTRGTRPSGCAR